MTILVVDDNEQNLYQLQVLLGGNGYQVVTAANGAEALAKARQNPPDLIVSDILMPVMDGFALCREWKKDERLQAIPFVFYTATYTDERDREFALSLGAERFLVKPEEPEVFMRTIREVHPASPASARRAGAGRRKPERRGSRLSEAIQRGAHPQAGSQDAAVGATTRTGAGHRRAAGGGGAAGKRDALPRPAREHARRLRARRHVGPHSGDEPGLRGNAGLRRGRASPGSPFRS